MMPPAMGTHVLHSRRILPRISIRRVNGHGSLLPWVRLILRFRARSYALSLQYWNFVIFLPFRLDRIPASRKRSLFLKAAVLFLNFHRTAFRTHCFRENSALSQVAFRLSRFDYLARLVMFELPALLLLVMLHGVFRLVRHN